MARILEKEHNNIIGTNVRKFRQQRGMSQQQLANKLELLPVYICRGSISRVEDQSRTVTDIEVAGLAEVLGVSIMDLFAQE